MYGPYYFSSALPNHPVSILITTGVHGVSKLYALVHQ